MKVNIDGVERDMTLEEQADFNLLIAGLVLPAPPFEPQSISDRQFFQQLAVQNLITQAEALAAVTTGTIPSAMQTFVNQLPVDQQFDATMKISGAREFLRSDPLVAAFGKMHDMSPGDIDGLWINASRL
jgi:hypothetical protein